MLLFIAHTHLHIVLSLWLSFLTHKVSKSPKSETNLKIAIIKFYLVREVKQKGHLKNQYFLHYTAYTVIIMLQLSWNWHPSFWHHLIENARASVPSRPPTNEFAGPPHCEARHLLHWLHYETGLLWGAPIHKHMLLPGLWLYYDEIVRGPTHKHTI